MCTDHEVHSMRPTTIIRDMCIQCSAAAIVKCDPFDHSQDKNLYVGISSCTINTAIHSFIAITHGHFSMPGNVKCSLFDHSQDHTTVQFMYCQ